MAALVTSSQHIHFRRVTSIRSHILLGSNGDILVEARSLAGDIAFIGFGSPV